MKTNNPSVKIAGIILIVMGAGSFFYMPGAMGIGTIILLLFSPLQRLMSSGMFDVIATAVVFGTDAALIVTGIYLQQHSKKAYVVSIILATLSVLSLPVVYFASGGQIIAPASVASPLIFAPSGIIGVILLFLLINKRVRSEFRIASTRLSNSNNPSGPGAPNRR